MPSSIPRAALRRSPRLLWLSTAMILAALLVALGGLIYLVYRDWVDEQRDNLIQEVLWLEQSIRLHMESHQEWGANVADALADEALTGAQFITNTRLFLRENPELLTVERVSADGHRLWNERNLALVQEPPLRNEAYSALWRASRLGRPAYGAYYRAADGKVQFDLVVPLFSQGRFVGGVRLVYGLERLLRYQVPWWIASKYHISVVDLGGRELASKFEGAVRADALTHQIGFDPPGDGLLLRATVYRSGVGLTMPAVAGVIALLVGALAYSLWRLRQHTRERTRAELALEREMTLREAMEDSMKSGLVAIGLEGEILHVNRAFCEMTGTAAQALVGQRPPHSYWPREERPVLERAMRAVRAGAQPEHGFELPFRRSDGERFEVRLYATPLVDRDGTQRGWIATLYDITELKKKRLALNLSHQRFLTVLNGLDAGVCVTEGGSAQLLYANPGFATMWLSCEPDGACCPVFPGLPRLAEAGGSGLEVVLNHGEHWYLLHRRAIEWVNGEAAWLTILSDVTEARQHEARERAQAERFQDTARLIAMGEMASSLAHELNQPLTAINTYASGLIRRLPADLPLPGGVRDAVQAIADQARRAGQIVNSIRAFVKKHAPQLEATDPSAVIRRAVGLAEGLAAKNGVALEVAQDGRVCRLEMDPVLIEQVLLNLIKNAIEAMVESQTRRPTVAIRTRVGPAYWHVEVADNGPGLAEDMRDRLFTPFYSTKQEGMGIGLNICRSIVEFHRGEFGVNATLSGGCLFWFTLPLLQAETTAA
ncbi:MULTISPECIES: PAS domain-containing sensor histidine kinase [Gulbenkiania]|uniref:histidine kinase n=1 Tax=Gulbenkiania indica TaxID=375574 RepID=A0A0K6H3K2_9NEIS|nr:MULTISPECIES: PAS domain-containing sensor histidine kinase [Gulbenkiania]CUA85411.1 PAS domain S-box [Gulbenkiania indica]